MSSKIDILRDRADMLAKVRSFFQERNVLEVDCPIMSPKASVDAHIDLIPAFPQGITHYLHSSPEYGMKKLLSDGIGDIFQLSHVFRDGEISNKHRPEFMMAEWYRLDFTFMQMIEETVDFCRLFLGNLPSSVLTYSDAFKEYLSIDLSKATNENLLAMLKKNNIQIQPELLLEGRDGLLNLLLGLFIEPHLGDNELTALAYYPPTQAALARKALVNGQQVAERFEIYYKGMELANGYHELADAHEQGQRLIDENKHRLKLGKEALPIDDEFLAALEKGLPDCCGVAVGFDRLMMLRHKTDQINTIIVSH